MQEVAQEQLCSMITFLPSFNTAQIDDAFRQAITTDKPEQDNFDIDINTAKSEFIFVLGIHNI